MTTTTTPTSETTVVEPDPAAVKREAAATQAATILGETPPPTPNLDKAKEAAAMTKTTPKAVKRSDKVRFTHDGMPMHESHMLGGVAFHYTKGLGAGGAKLTSGQLGDLIYTLKDLKTGKPPTDIYEPGWEVQLPNGIKIGAIKPSEVEAYRKKAKAAGTRSSVTPKADKTPDRTSARAAAAASVDKPDTPSKATGVTKKAAGKTTGATKPTKATKAKTTTKRTGPSNPAGRARADARAATTKVDRSKDKVTPLPKAKDAAKGAKAAATA